MAKIDSRQSAQLFEKAVEKTELFEDVSNLVHSIHLWALFLLRYLRLFMTILQDVSIVLIPVRIALFLASSVLHLLDERKTTRREKIQFALFALLLLATIVVGWLFPPIEVVMYVAYAAVVLLRGLYVLFRRMQEYRRLAATPEEVSRAYHTAMDRGVNVIANTLTLTGAVLWLVMGAGPVCFSILISAIALQVVYSVGKVVVNKINAALKGRKISLKAAIASAAVVGFVATPGLVDAADASHEVRAVVFSSDAGVLEPVKDGVLNPSGGNDNMDDAAAYVGEFWRMVDPDADQQMASTKDVLHTHE